MNLISQGTKQAKPLDWGYVELGEKHTPAVQIKFGFEDEGTHRELTWTGFLTEKAKRNTLQALITCGFHDQDFSRFIHGTLGNALDRNKEVAIVVEHEENNGKTFAKIKWINAPAGAKFREMNVADALAKTKALALEGDILMLHQELGIKTNKNDDIPW